VLLLLRYAVEQFRLGEPCVLKWEAAKRPLFIGRELIFSQFPQNLCFQDHRTNHSLLFACAFRKSLSYCLTLHAKSTLAPELGRYTKQHAHAVAKQVHQ
jgi:hypothetical protein